MGNLCWVIEVYSIGSVMISMVVIVSSWIVLCGRGRIGFSVLGCSVSVEKFSSDVLMLKDVVVKVEIVVMLQLFSFSLEQICQCIVVFEIVDSLMVLLKVQVISLFVIVIGSGSGLLIWCSVDQL